MTNNDDLIKIKEDAIKIQEAEFFFKTSSDFVQKVPMNS